MILGQIKKNIQHLGKKRNFTLSAPSRRSPCCSDIVDCMSSQSPWQCHCTDIHFTFKMPQWAPGSFELKVKLALAWPLQVAGLVIIKISNIAEAGGAVQDLMTSVAWPQTSQNDVSLPRCRPAGRQPGHIYGCHPRLSYLNSLSLLSRVRREENRSFRGLISSTFQSHHHCETLPMEVPSLESVSDGMMLLLIIELLPDKQSCSLR